MAESELLHAYGYLTQPEIRFLDAAAERLIPTDELGPGGKDAGIACYIDGQLRSGVFVAVPGSMITKCPSKYAPKQSGDSA